MIGAGVVGIACATALANSGRDVLVLERNATIGEETSARNSEVIHAGIYYRPGSAKARLCMAGKARLYAYCQAMGVPARQVGKLVVSGRQQDRPPLRRLLQRGRANGVSDLRWLTPADVRTLEPAVHCQSAILSPSTGIVDSHQLMMSLMGELDTLGGHVSVHSQVISLQPDAGKGIAHRVMVDMGPDREVILAREVVNCAGLHAVPLAQTRPDARTHDLPDAIYTRGNYFRLRGRAPFSHLVYPLPEPGGLGIHLTLDMAGCARFGPDVEAIGGLHAGYGVACHRAAFFYDRIRRYWPDLPDGTLMPDYAGIRPQITRPGQGEMDFEILGPRHHHVSGLVHCLGIESPGLTACLAIADQVTAELGEPA